MSRRHNLGRRRATIAALLGLAGMLLVVSAIAVAGHASHRAKPVPLVNRGVLTTLGKPRPSSRIKATQGSLTSGSRLVIPRVHTDASIVGVVASHGVMQIPSDPSVVGWWTGGAAPGSGAGHIVLVGHVNYRGETGALGVLPDLQPGDIVAVGTTPHQLKYRVSALRSYPKTIGLPRNVFTPDGPEELVLITCGGSFDAASGNYRDNIVAYANPVAKG